MPTALHDHDFGTGRLPPVLPSKAALFLDFDGTLVPTAPRPQDVRVPGWVVPILRQLQQRLDGALALVSGRPLSDLDGLVRPLHLPAVGVHGVERRLSDGRTRIKSAEVPSMARQATEVLAQRNPGLLVEPKPGALAVHFRACPELEPLCLLLLRAALLGAEHWEVLRGRCVAEVKPRHTSRGRAVAAFLTEPAFSGHVPVYVGCNDADEDGIAVAQKHGGFGVRVGPGATCARYHLEDPHAVRRWLGASSDAREYMTKEN
jgi:trehalose 6-phosphate phosphatase